MGFNSRTQFKTAASSEKITLAHVNAKDRLYVFNGPTMGIYTKTVPYFVAGVKQNNLDLVGVDSANLVDAGNFHYEPATGLLSLALFGNEDPQENEVIVTYKFFFGSKSISTTHNLQDISDSVFYDGRIDSSPGYKHKIGIDQALTSLIGEGTLVLANNDGGLDLIYDSLIFENQDVVIYSWNLDLKPSEARVIYRGRVTNKSFNTNTINLKIKDQLFSLLDSPVMAPYTEADNVAKSALGQYKRRVYGRVDGLRAQSVDQIGDGVILPGTFSAAANSTALSSSGIDLYDYVRQGDTIVIGTQEFTIDDILSASSATLSDETEYSFSGQTAILRPNRGVTYKNREFIAAGHLCAEVTRQIVSVPQFNRFVVDNTDGLFAGDFVEFVETAERIEIKNIAPGNIVVLQQNMVTKPTVGTLVTRQPIQEIYVNSQRINADDYTVNNTGNTCGFTLQNDVEFNLVRPRNTTISATFTNGSRNVSYVDPGFSISETLTVGDYIKPNNNSYTTYYQISVIREDSSTIVLSELFGNPNISEDIQFKSPDYIEDDTVISVNILGKTEDGTANGEWIQTVPQITHDLLSEIGVNSVNEDSFTTGKIDSYQLVSIAIPYSFNSKSLPTVKDITDKLNKSVRGSLTLDNDLLIKYQTLNVYTGENLVEIDDSQVIDWKVDATNGKTYRTAQVKYRFTDVDLATLEDGSSFLSADSEFVDRYIGTTKIDEINLYLYSELDAYIMGRRHLYYNRLGTATVTLKTDLRLEDVEIGDVVIINFRRLYGRFGNGSHRKKTVLVIGKELNGERTNLTLSDLGNTFNTSGFITPNDAPDYTSATDDQKLIHGYITDNQGIVNNDENTAGINLIS